MKDIIVTALYNLGYVLIFPGFLFCFFAGLLLCGIDRKLVANREAVAIAEAAMDKLVNEHTSAAYDDFLKTVEGESK